MAIASDLLRIHAGLLEIEGVRSHLRLRRVLESLGAHHVIFQQRHLGLRIYRAYVTIHIDRHHRVYLVKNRAVPARLLPPRARFRLQEGMARRRAFRSLPARGRAGRVLEVERMWFAIHGYLRTAYRVRVQRERPAEEWIVYVDGTTGAILSKYNNLAEARGRAVVFDPNPVIALGDWRPLIANGRRVRPPSVAYATVPLFGLRGNGYLDGRRVSTRLTLNRVSRPDHQFLFRSTEHGFEETMVYFHIDRAVRYLESLGYRGRRAIFNAPVLVDARGTRADDSWYSPGLKRLVFGTGEVNDAEDGEMILHEFGHALQDAICPDFGQSLQSAAMGEGFGDYLAASFFASKKPLPYRTSVASWEMILSRQHDPPCVRRVDADFTYESFDHGPGADEHQNGLIWSAALWEIWQAVGREVADRIIIESHFQLDGFTTFAQGARAILDADRNLYRGRHASHLRRIFRRRGIGPVE